MDHKLIKLLAAFLLFAIVVSSETRFRRECRPLGVQREMCTLNTPPSVCRSNEDCEGLQLCCPTHCMGDQCTTDFTIVKPGVCPRFLMMCPNTNEGCTSDGDCPGREKCCAIQCGPLNCTAPA